MVSPARCSGPMTSSSNVRRAARERGSVRRTKAIMGSLEATTAASPPRQRPRRTAGSPSRLPATRLRARSSAPAPPRRLATAGESTPSPSLHLVSQSASRSRSRTGDMGRSSSATFRSRARRCSLNSSLQPRGAGRGSARPRISPAAAPRRTAESRRRRHFPAGARRAPRPHAPSPPCPPRSRDRRSGRSSLGSAAILARRAASSLRRASRKP